MQAAGAAQAQAPRCCICRPQQPSAAEAQRRQLSLPSGSTDGREYVVRQREEAGGCWCCGARR